MASYAKFMECYQKHLRLLSKKHKAPWETVRDAKVCELVGSILPNDVPLHTERVRPILLRLISKDDAPSSDPLLNGLMEDLWLASASSGYTTHHPCNDINRLCTWSSAPQGRDMWEELHNLE